MELGAGKQNPTTSVGSAAEMPAAVHAREGASEGHRDEPGDEQLRQAGRGARAATTRRKLEMFATLLTLLRRLHVKAFPGGSAPPMP